MREKDRTAGLVLGILGSCLIFISSLVGWKKGEDYYGYMRGAPKSTTFYAPLLMLGLALLAGILLAYLWREHSAGAIFSIIVSGGVCAVGFGFAVAQIIAAEPGSSGIIGTGAYLGLAGGLLALLGSLLLLSSRKVPTR
jgi:multisubunit Na+/H+ antiporter MnhG subunit